MDPTDFMSIEDTPEFASYEQYEAEFRELREVRYEVQTYTLCDGWTNTWQEDDAPLTFASKAEAEAALELHLVDINESFQEGHLSDGANLSDYRVVCVGYVDPSEVDESDIPF